MNFHVCGWLSYEIAWFSSNQHGIGFHRINIINDTRRLLQQFQWHIPLNLFLIVHKAAYKLIECVFACFKEVDNIRPVIIYLIVLNVNQWATRAARVCIHVEFIAQYVKSHAGVERKRPITTKCSHAVLEFLWIADDSDPCTVDKRLCVAIQHIKVALGQIEHAQFSQHLNIWLTTLTIRNMRHNSQMLIETDASTVGCVEWVNNTPLCHVKNTGADHLGIAINRQIHFAEERNGRIK